MYNMEKGSVNYGLVALVAVAAAVISSLVTCKVMSSRDANFAYVDVQRVFMSSKDIAAANDERRSKEADLQRMINEANAEIEKVKKEDAKKELTQKHLAEINAKKIEYDRQYASAMQAAGQKIKGVINSVAEKEGIKVVFSNTSLLNGGVDVTDAVIEQLR